MIRINYFLTVAIILTIAYGAFCQPDSLIVEIKRFGNSSKFKINNTTLSIKDLDQKYSKYDDAYYEFSEAKKNRSASKILGISGTVLASIFIGAAYANPLLYQPAPIYIGLGLVCASIPLNSAYNKRARKAMNIYNSHLNKQP